MASLEEYKKYEKSFLPYIAEQWGFKERCKLVFEQRFLSDNDDLENKDLAEILKNNLRTDKPDADIITIFRDELKKIFGKLENKGCNFNGQKKDKLPIAKPWLRETIFSQYKQDFFWYLMKSQSSQTDKMKPILVPPKQIATLDWLQPKQPKHNYVKSVSLGSQIHFEIDLDQPGHLLLLQKGTSGTFWCLCPSFVVTNTYLPAGKTILPQEKLRDDYFEISGKPGQDEMLAVISPELPSFNWLPKVQDGDPLEMTSDNLHDLVEYLERQKPAIFYMHYTITA